MLVTPAGGRLWRFKYRRGVVEKLLTLGAYPDVSLKRTREKRDDARKLVADEVDPRFEFRRSLFRRKGVERVIIYSSTPEQRVSWAMRILARVSSVPAHCVRRKASTRAVSAILPMKVCSARSTRRPV